MEILEIVLIELLCGIYEGDIKKEYLLPELIDQLIHSGKAAVDVLETKDEWFGVTYLDDKASVQAAFKKLTDDDVYPEGLYQIYRRALWVYNSECEEYLQGVLKPAKCVSHNFDQKGA